MKLYQSLLLFVFTFCCTLTNFAQTADVREGCIPLEVNFIAPTGQFSFFWDFKDGGISSDQNPSYIFTEAGTFDVEFKNFAAGPVVGTVTINVYETPELMISTDDPTEGCVPLTITFEDNSTINPNIPVDAYNWFYNIGSDIGGGSSSTFTFNQVGTFNVGLGIESSLPNCTVQETFEDFVTTEAQPSISFITDPNPPASCTAPLNDVSFTITSETNLDYVWDFDGTPFSGTNPPNQDYETDGNYEVNLTGTSSNGCSATATTIVSVGEPFVDFEVNDTICVGAATEITNLTQVMGAFTWDFGNGETSNLNNPIIQYDTPGLYTITLTIETPIGCIGDTSKMILVQQPDPTFTADPAYSCTGELTTTFTPNNIDNEGEYFWVFADLSISQETTPTHTYIEFDTAVYSINEPVILQTILTHTTSGGCVDFDTDVVTIHRPNAEFMPDVAQGCAPLAVVFSDSSMSNEPIVEWIYDFGDGIIETYTTEDPVSHTFTAPGEYEVTLMIENEAGCRDTSYAIEIIVGDALSIDFTVDQTTVCPGDTVNLETVSTDPLIDAWHFETDNGRSFHCYNEDELEWSFITETGDMDVSLQVEYNGCFSEITKTDLISVQGPIADIYYEIDCTTPFQVMFADSSSGAITRTWDLGDGNTSMLNEFTHTYADTGDYVVKLTSVNPFTGCPESVDSLVVCIRDIKADIQLDTLICTGQEYMLDASNSEGVDARCWRGYCWDIPFSNRPITTQDAVTPFVFSPTEDQIVELVVTDINGCTDTATLDVRVYEVQTVFEMDDDVICLPGTINFTDLTQADTTIATWEWTFGDGNMGTDSLDSNTYLPGTVPDNFTVTLDVEDVLGCPGSATLPVFVYQPTSDIGPMEPIIICEGDDVAFTSTDFTEQGSSLSFDWDFGNGQTSTNMNETVNYPDAGDYTASLTYTEIATGCEGTASLDVEVQAYPMADFSSSADGLAFICPNEDVNFFDGTISDENLFYQWDFGLGGFVFEPNPTNIQFPQGAYDVTLTVTTQGGNCSDTHTEQLEALGPQGDIVLSTTEICSDGEITFTAIDLEDVAVYEWQFGDGTSVENEATVTHTYDLDPTITELTVDLILTGGPDGNCVTTVSEIINIFPIDAGFTTANGEFTSCDPTFNFVNQSFGATQYSWDFGDGNTSNAENPTHSYANAGEYEVVLMVSNSAGCTASFSQTVSYIGGVEPIDADLVVLSGREICLLPNPQNIDFENITWDTFPEPSPTYIYEPQLTQDSVISLNVTGFADSCESDAITFNYDITVIPELDIPNTFTPNNDGFNDRFTITLGEVLQSYFDVTSFKIFNRWGQMVFEGNSTQGWDGRYNNNNAPSDVYLYYLELSYNDNVQLKEGESATFMYQGDVTLLR